MSQLDYASMAKEIGETVGADKVATEISERMSYSRDWSVRPASDACLPDIVVRPTSTEDVAEIVKIANRYKVPVTPCGGLTGMAGGAVASSGGIMVDTRGMNKVLEIDEDNLTVTTQVGISIFKLNEELEKNGLWFPHEPESRRASTVGSAIACRNVPTMGIKYGRIENSLISATVVTGRGEVIKVGHRKTLVSSSGYQLHWLLISSEGTLGIITEATLRVFPKPKSRTVDLVAFPSIAKAVQALNRIVQAGLSIEAVYVMCEDRFYHYTHDFRAKHGREARVAKGTKAVVLISFNGDTEVADFSRDYMLRTSLQQGGTPIEEREIVESAWASKYTLAFEPFNQAWPDSQRLARFGAADVSVPQGRLDEAFKKYQELAKKYELKIYGMGIIVEMPCSVHTTISFAVYVDDKNPKQVQNYYDFVRDMAMYAVSVGGSMTSYQGDGEKFGEFCRYEHGEAFKYMKMIKEVFDPNNVLNPGKKFGPPRWIKPL